MSPVIITPPPVPPGSDPASGIPPTLTITYYHQLATHFSEVLDEISAIIPRLENAQVGPPTVVRAHLSVPLPFLGTAVASVEELPELQAVKALDPNEGRDILQLIDAFGPLSDKVAAFQKDLRNVLNSRRSLLAGQALDTYDHAKSFNRDPNNAAMASWVANMKRDLGRRGPRKKKPAPTPVPVPVSTPTAQTPEDAQG